MRISVFSPVAARRIVVVVLVVIFGTTACGGGVTGVTPPATGPVPIDVSVSLPPGTPVPAGSLSVVTSADAASLSTAGTARVKTDIVERQVQVVVTPGNNPLLLSYVLSPSVSSVIRFDARTTVLALAMMSPVFADVTLEEARDILQRVETHPDFPGLVNLLETRIASDPERALNAEVYPDIYDRVLQIVISVTGISPLSPAFVLPPDSPSRWLVVTEDADRKLVTVENKLRHVFVARITDPSGKSTTERIRESSLWALGSFLIKRLANKHTLAPFGDGLHQVEFFAGKGKFDEIFGSGPISEAFYLNVMLSVTDVFSVALSLADIPKAQWDVACVKATLTALPRIWQAISFEDPKAILEGVRDVLVEVAKAPQPLSRCVSESVGLQEWLLKATFQKFFETVVPVVNGILKAWKASKAVYTALSWIPAQHQVYLVAYPHFARSVNAYDNTHNGWNVLTPDPVTRGPDPVLGTVKFRPTVPADPNNILLEISIANAAPDCTLTVELVTTGTDSNAGLAPDGNHAGIINRVGSLTTNSSGSGTAALIVDVRRLANVAPAGRVTYAHLDLEDYSGTCTEPDGSRVEINEYGASGKPPQSALPLPVNLHWTQPASAAPAALSRGDGDDSR